jgi:hypothetical protein
MALDEVMRVCSAPRSSWKFSETGALRIGAAAPGLPEEGWGNGWMFGAFVQYIDSSGSALPATAAPFDGADQDVVGGTFRRTCWAPPRPGRVPTAELCPSDS